MWIRYGTIDPGWDSALGIFSNGDVLRGLSGISLGVVIYSKGKNKKIYKYAHIFEFICFLAATLSAVYLESIYIPFLFIVFSCYFGFNNKKESKIYNKIISILTKISYSIYLNHALFVDYHLLDFIDSIAIRSVVYVVCIILVSFVTNLIGKAVIRIFNKILWLDFKWMK